MAPEINPVLIAKQLKMALKAKGWNNRDLANASGVPPSTVSDAVAGRVLPELVSICKMALALDTTVDDLVFPKTVVRSGELYFLKLNHELSTLSRERIKTLYELAKFFNKEDNE